ncbi:hypothetical protein BDR03DRAFT_949934 [Suillus americanus]|nr:hypothetical protein BDR03DRAFT_949934 [Suillus americanus]
MSIRLRTGPGVLHLLPHQFYSACPPHPHSESLSLRLGVLCVSCHTAVSRCQARLHLVKNDAASVLCTSLIQAGLSINHTMTSSPASLCSPNNAPTTLPASKSAIKQWFNVSINEEAKTVLRNSPRSDKFREIDPSYPSNRFAKLADEYPRKHAALLIQIYKYRVP